MGNSCTLAPMQKLTKTLCALILFAAGFAPGLAQQMTALETAQLAVETLLQQVRDTQHLFVTDSEAYYGGVEEVLDRFVDFNVVAEVVMNRFADSASDEQKQRFGLILRRNLTRFYGAALLTYAEQEVVFLPSENPERDSLESTIVTMELAGGGAQTVLFQYQMFLNDGNEWKLRNLSLAGINLGRQYFTQFSALMTQHGNDIDAVLDNWQ